MILRRAYQKEKVTPSASEKEYTVKTKTYAVLFNTSCDPALEVLKEVRAEIIRLQKASLASLAISATPGFHSFYHSAPMALADRLNENYNCVRQ